MSGLIEENWILITVSVFSLLKYIVLAEGYEENLAAHRYVIEERDILIAFADNCGYSSLLLYQNWMSGSFLKVSWNVESEILPTNFSYFVAL